MPISFGLVDKSHLFVGIHGKANAKAYPGKPRVWWLARKWLMWPTEFTQRKEGAYATHAPHHSENSGFDGHRVEEGVDPENGVANMHLTKVWGTKGSPTAGKAMPQVTQPTKWRDFKPSPAPIDHLQPIPGVHS